MNKKENEQNAEPQSESKKEKRKKNYRVTANEKDVINQMFFDYTDYTIHTHTYRERYVEFDMEK